MGAEGVRAPRKGYTLGRPYEKPIHDCVESWVRSRGIEAAADDVLTGYRTG